MWQEDSRTVLERASVEEELKLDRRAAILGAGCVALAAILPGRVHAGGWAGTRVRSAVATLPRQSPIDFRESDITLVRRLPKICFGYPRCIDVTLVNTGSPGEFKTVRADVPPGAAHVTLSGVRWNLLQFHWHTPSEHEIEGRETPLEMHLVHSRVPDGAFLVLGVFMEQGRSNGARRADVPDASRRGQRDARRLRRTPQGPTPRRA
jgi:carbonic anhydrase